MIRTRVFLGLLTLVLSSKDAWWVREMVPGEVTPVAAEQTHTELFYEAGNAIDRNMDTRSHAGEPLDSDGTPWLKVKLGDVYCVDRVVVYWESISAHYSSWSCTPLQEDCICEQAQQYCKNYLISVNTENSTSSGRLQPTRSGCRLGDTVKLYSDLGYDIIVYELVTTAKSECFGFDPSWTALKTDCTFPIVAHTQIQVSCETGYRHQGDSTVTCVKGTEFSFTSKPNCVAECSGFDPSWTALKTTATFPIVADTEIQVSCWTGYRHQGDSTVTCVRETEFSFTSKPKCVAECSGFDPSWTALKTTATFPIVANTEIQVSCWTGYRHQGDSTVTCEKGTQFSFTSKPNCGIDTCSGLEDTVKHLTTDQAFPVDYGTVLTVTCKERDHILRGSNTITCVKDTKYMTDETTICDGPAVLMWVVASLAIIFFLTTTLLTIYTIRQSGCRRGGPTRTNSDVTGAGEGGKEGGTRDDWYTENIVETTAEGANLV